MLETTTTTRSWSSALRLAEPDDWPRFRCAGCGLTEKRPVPPRGSRNSRRSNDCTLARASSRFQWRCASGSRGDEGRHAASSRSLGGGYSRWCSTSATKGEAHLSTATAAKRPSRSSDLSWVSTSAL